MQIRDCQYLIFRKDFFSGFFHLLFWISILCPEHDTVIFCCLSIYFLIILRRKIYVMSHIVLTDMRNFYCDTFCHTILKIYRISFFYIQKFCRLLTDNCTIVCKFVWFFRLSVMEIFIFSDNIRIAKYALINAAFFISLWCRHALHPRIHISLNIRIFFQIFLQLFFLCLCYIILVENMPVIQLDLIVLNICDLIYRILYPISNQHQCHTAANSKYRHKETFFITHQVSDCWFPCEIHSFPNKSNSF